MTDQDAKAARIAGIRQFSDDGWKVHQADVRFLLAEYDSLAAELARYRDAFAGMYIAPGAYEHPTLWLQQGDGRPESMGCHCGLPTPFWDALVTVLGVRDQ